MLVDLIRVPDPTCIDDLLDEPLGLLYLAAVLREHGYEARITNLAGHTAESWKTVIKEADVYAIQLYTPTAIHGINIAHHIKKHFPGKPVLGGGAHPSAVPEHEDLAVFDYLSIGEGERSIIKIMDAITKQVPLERIVKSPVIEDLDSLPFPARDLVNMTQFHRKVKGARCFGIIGSRGCCYKCAFCDHALFGSRVRWRSVDNIVAEIQHIIDTYGVRNFEFFDDMFTIDKRRLKDFYSKVKGLNIRYRCNGRTDILDPETYDILRESGCELICYGIESGAQSILDKMQKQTTVEINARAIKMAQDAGLIVAGYFLLGFPGETKETIQKTIDFIEQTNIDQAQFYTFIPLPGCEVWKDPDKFGVRIISRNFADYFLVTGDDGRGGKTIETDSMTAEDLAVEMKRIREFLRKRGARGAVQDYYKEKLKYESE